MSICTFWKVLCDCCIFIGIMGSMPDFFPCRIPLIIPAIVCALSAASACYCRRKGHFAISVICALLPLVLFLFATSGAEMLILIPPVLYAVLYGILGRYALEYRTFRKAYPLTAGILFVWAVMLTVPANIDLKHRYLQDVPFIFGALYLLSGVLLLQQLRMGNSCDQRSNWVQYATIAGSFTLAVGFSYLLGQILNGFIKLLAFLASFLNREAEKPGGYFDYQKQKTELTQELYPPPEPSAPAWHHYNDIPPKVVEEPAEKDPWLLIAGILCVLVVIAVIMLAKSKKHIPSEAKEVYEGSVLLFQKEKKRPKQPNRSKIRKYYQEYLRLERGRGVKLRQFMTSADILDASACGADSEAARTLREVYVAARYGENTEITPEQVQIAKAALKQIRASSRK